MNRCGSVRSWGSVCSTSSHHTGYLILSCKPVVLMITFHYFKYLLDTVSENADAARNAISWGCEWTSGEHNVFLLLRFHLEQRNESVMFLHGLTKEQT